MKIAVIGAGLAGLAAAYDLARAGHQVTIYEADDHVGGLAAGFKEPHWDWSVERYYHHWFATDRHILGLIRELGWEDKVRFPRPYTVIYHQGRSYPFDSMFTNMPLFLLRRYPLPDVVRFGLVGLYLRLANDWRPLEAVTAEAWMRKWVGERIYQTLWKPLLVGKFGPHYREVNMAWLWARLKARTTRLGTFEGGFQAFADALADHLRGLGVEIQLSAPVVRLTPDPAGGLVLDLPAGPARHDQCLATVAPALLARMVPDLPAAYLQGLLALRSMGAVVLVLALRHRLSEQGYYWYNLPKEAGFPFLALVEHTNFLPPACFGGEHIVYCGDYLDPDHEYFHLSEAELLERFQTLIQRSAPHAGVELGDGAAPVNQGH